jgi:hypothetical protein
LAAALVLPLLLLRLMMTSGPPLLTGPALGGLAQVPFCETCFPLAQRDNAVEFRLSAGQVVRPQRLPELLQIALPSLKILLQLLIDRRTGNGGCRH